MEPGLGGRCPNGVQHTGIKFSSYCGGGGGPKVDGLLVLPPRSEIFLVRTLYMLINIKQIYVHVYITRSSQPSME